MMQKLYFIQALRGIAAMMVVAYHSLSIQTKYISESDLLPGFFRIGQTGVDLFFAISGFVMVLAAEPAAYNLTQSLTFLQRRALRIYPTYWVYFSALLVVFLVSPGMINNSEGGRVDLVRSFFLIPSETLPLLMVAWTLTHELWFYIVFSILLFSSSNVRVVGLLIWMAIIIASQSYNTSFESPTSKVIFHIYTLEFILGALSASLYLRIKSHKFLNAIMAASLAASLTLTLSWFMLEWQNVLIDNIHISMDRAIIIGSGYSLALFCLALAETNGWLSIPNTLRWLGDISFSIYLSHVLILSVCGRLWLFFNPDMGTTFAQAALFWIATIALVIIGGHVAYLLLERPLSIFSNKHLVRKPKQVHLRKSLEG